jgi:hypothetical protein
MCTQHLTRQPFKLIDFYVMYFLEFLVKWMVLKNRFKAYRAISFEREAYGNERNLNYLKKRKMFVFFNYY